MSSPTASTIGRFVALFAIGIVCIGIVAWYIGTSLMPAQATAHTLHPLTLTSPTGGTSTLSVEWATTEAERELGLMNRPQVDHGMLFIFDTQQMQTFWMKNTLVPLDIVFFTDRGQYVSSARMTPCTSDPCALYSSGSPARYALEMPAGFIDQSGIGKGWMVRP